ncbi:thioesterase family protein [Nocardioides coralli]|uniref:thioesterase family protein n=1 Tax=Nocardioides coralli TaxID=2872154 RepID=UPI001CA44FB6|nr:thioesterase family protein [Nocardioides coralli]QZY29520.1 thioesterase family protein [Nocardioides coralli]
MEPLPSTASPWGSQTQHGGPPAALLAWAVEGVADGVVGRFTMELLGPVPVAPLSVSARIERKGRRVQLVAAELYDEQAARSVAHARAWLFPRVPTDGPATPGRPPATAPADGRHHPRPEGWSGGYLDAVEWRWVEGAVEEPGPGVVWMRAPDLFADQPTSPVQRLLACADSASGASAVLDPRTWGFLNTELTVHVVREPEDEWLLLDAETVLAGGSLGLASATVHDPRGLVARSNQALLVSRR